MSRTIPPQKPKLSLYVTHTAVSPVDVQEGEGEESLVALLGEELLFKLDKISLKVDHFWSTAVRPAQKSKQSFIGSRIYDLAP